MVPGVCPIENAGSFTAVCHTGFWVAWDFVVLAVGVASIGFGLWVGAKGDLVKDITRTRSWLVAWLVLLILGIAAHIVHFVATIFEMRDCETTLCVDSNTQGFLTAILVGIGALIVLEVLQFYRGYTHAKHIRQVNKFHLGFLTMKMPMPKDTVVDFAPSEQVATAVRSAKARVGHGLKQRSE